MGNALRAARWLVVRITQICEVACWGILLGWVVFLTWGVASRYLLNAPIVSQSDVVSASMVVFCSICLAPVLLREAHIKMDLFVRLLPPAAQTLLRVCAHLVAVGFAVLMFIASQHLLADTIIMESRYEISGIPLAPVQAFIPFGFVLFGIVAVLMLVDTVGTALAEQKP